jgi:hypothetical protein
MVLRKTQNLEGIVMIHHIVLVKFKGGVTREARQEIWDSLDALSDVIDGIESAAFGVNVSPEGFSRGYDDGFVMVFRDTAARDVYLEHPAHKAAGASLIAALEGGFDGLLVVDI